MLMQSLFIVFDPDKIQKFSQRKHTLPKTGENFHPTRGGILADQIPVDRRKNLGMRVRNLWKLCIPSNSRARTGLGFRGENPGSIPDAQGFGCYNF